MWLTRYVAESGLSSNKRDACGTAARRQPPPLSLGRPAHAGPAAAVRAITGVQHEDRNEWERMAPP